MEKNEIEYLVDDTPIDFSSYDKYTVEEIERLYAECFGDKTDD